MTEIAMSRRRLLGTVAGATALAGCTGSAEQSEPTTTETATATTTMQETTTVDDNEEVTNVELPEAVQVGEPLTLEVTVENPDGEPLMMIWAVRVIDTVAGKEWARTFNLNGEEGETSFTETIEIEWGTDHETELLVEPGAASMSILGGEDYESTTTFRRVEVVSDE